MRVTPARQDESEDVVVGGSLCEKESRIGSHPSRGRRPDRSDNRTAGERWTLPQARIDAVADDDATVAARPPPNADDEVVGTGAGIPA
jgi:hypothetical protein